MSDTTEFCAKINFQTRLSKVFVLTFSIAQMDRIAKDAFYVRLSRFFVARGLSEGFRRAALDVTATYALWDAHWQASWTRLQPALRCLLQAPTAEGLTFAGA